MGSISKIETLGLLDGPGIRTVVFLNGCPLRCKYCHNPETWQIKENNYTEKELVEKLKRNKPYYKASNGGVTFSGGEPLTQLEYLTKVAKLLKKENIHIALDTSGQTNKNPQELLKYIDLVILDIKHTTKEGYKKLTQGDIEKQENFIKELNKTNIPVWIRQVIVPNITDSKEYIESLKNYLKKIKNIKKIELLPFHHLGFSKYKELNIPNPLLNTKEMDTEICKKLEQELKKELNIE